MKGCIFLQVRRWIGGIGESYCADIKLVKKLSKVPEVGDKFVDKECIHRYVCNYIKFTNRNITNQ